LKKKKEIVLKRMNNLFSIKDKIALVTGAGSGGIGEAIAEGFEKAGAVVFYGIHHLNVRDKPDPFKIELNIANDNSRRNIIEKIAQYKNQLDILVNAAGITRPGHENILAWDETIEINLTSIFLLCRLVKDAFMIRQLKGSIINITSICADLAFSGNPSYNVSKAGLKMLTKSLAKDLVKYNIRVNNLCPGYFDTKMTQKSQNDVERYDKIRERIMSSRFGKSEELIGPAIFLASDASSYMTGSDLVIDGGFINNGV